MNIGEFVKILKKTIHPYQYQKYVSMKKKVLYHQKDQMVVQGYLQLKTLTYNKY